MSAKRKRTTRKRWTKKEQRRAWAERNPKKKRFVVYTGEENPIRIVLDPESPINNCYGGPCFDLDEESALSLSAALLVLVTDGGFGKEW